ncbi:MAG: 2-oxoglutarate and iron-dependent oxygenase domain-containing protein [Verrucomicrobiaceae bacterium]
MSIPVIDLSRFRNGDTSERRAVARETDRVCREIGFLSVTSHRVPEPLIADIYQRSKNFFRQPVTRKESVRQPGPDVVRGYIGFARGALATTRGETTPPDLKESYSIGPEREEESQASGSFNQWPADDPGFCASWLSYYAEMERLSGEMMELFAEALDLERNYFYNGFGNHSSVLSAIYYPDQVKPPAEGQLRAGAHTDFGTMTILRPDNAPGGLEVMPKSGEWMPARPAPGSLVINIGDLMARWTNDRWVSTLHRVVNPPRDIVSGTERLSIGFFHQPDDVHVVECLPSCRSADGSALYPPVTAGSYMKTRFTSQIVRQETTS